MTVLLLTRSSSSPRLSPFSLATEQPSSVEFSGDHLRLPPRVAAEETIQLVIGRSLIVIYSAEGGEHAATRRLDRLSTLRDGQGRKIRTNPLEPS